MQVSIVGRHMDVPESFKEYAETKLAKLPRVFDRVMMIEVILEGQASQKSVEILVSAAGHSDFVAREEGDDVFACFDLCHDKIDHQLRRYKEKIRNRKHPERPGAGGS
ncbi:MAG: ribosome-associated translation inhibitor RaiA [Phycisphaerae bacterium]|nr:ribosome-associated translation inhibitor RaiA [Phycisphaerae bacterium]